MSHPEIPPNSEFFGKYEDGTAYFRFTMSGVGHKFPLGEEYASYWKSNPQVKGLVRAAGMVGWRDEAERLDRLIGDMCARNIVRATNKDGDPEYTGELRSQMSECYEHEMQWERVGRTKRPSGI